MQLFSLTQKATVQRIYTGVVTALRQRYGANTQFEGINFTADGMGNVISMLVTINIETSPDVDGVVIRHRKQVEVWE